MTKDLPKDYLHNGAYRLALQIRKLAEQIPEPNRAYAVNYAKYLEINNRKERTVERRLNKQAPRYRRLEQDMDRLQLQNSMKDCYTE